MPRSFASAVIDAPPSVVWDFVKNFNGTPLYLDLVAESVITDGQSVDLLGCERVITLTDGRVVKETLVARDDIARSLTYHLTEGPFPFSNYYSTMRVTLISDTGGSFVDWSSVYDCDAVDAEANDHLLADQIYGAGLSQIKSRFVPTRTHA
ncbi:SRPBCC family protein [Aeromicrobium ginsengisoli]|uniref:SRPBCC family protein n=1 Tax=Aeromicrobium ginsengisoli TaxID=363867 RepID=UPI00165F0A52|nr:SRPBCC family protein [Aeromicrobium ginsengisoli]